MLLLRQGRRCTFRRSMAGEQGQEVWIGEREWPFGTGRNNLHGCGNSFASYPAASSLDAECIAEASHASGRAPEDLHRMRMSVDGSVHDASCSLMDDTHGRVAARSPRCAIRDCPPGMTTSVSPEG